MGSPGKPLSVETDENGGLLTLRFVTGDGQRLSITRDGDTPVFNTVESRPKAKSMRRDPRVTLTIVDPENGYSYVELRGRVEFEEGQAANDTIDALAKKYIDQDTYPWSQPGDVRVNCRMIVERELGM